MTAPHACIRRREAIHLLPPAATRPMLVLDHNIWEEEARKIIFASDQD
jgi:hypothetical protein